MHISWNGLRVPTNVCSVCTYCAIYRVFEVLCACSEFRACPVCPKVLCKCLLVGIDWACPLMYVLWTKAQSIDNNNQMQASSNDNKWVIDLSNTPLTQAQESLLSKGPNYAIAPKHHANLDYITAIETACWKLNNQDAEELRTDINALLRKLHGPLPNLNKEGRH